MIKHCSTCHWRFCAYLHHVININLQHCLECCHALQVCCCQKQQGEAAEELDSQVVWLSRCSSVKHDPSGLETLGLCFCKQSKLYSVQATRRVRLIEFLSAYLNRPCMLWIRSSASSRQCQGLVMLSIMLVQAWFPIQMAGNQVALAGNYSKRLPAPPSPLCRSVNSCCC